MNSRSRQKAIIHRKSHTNNKTRRQKDSRKFINGGYIERKHEHQAHRSHYKTRSTPKTRKDHPLTLVSPYRYHSSKSLDIPRQSITPCSLQSHPSLIPNANLPRLLLLLLILPEPPPRDETENEDDDDGNDDADEGSDVDLLLLLAGFGFLLVVCAGHEREGFVGDCAAEKRYVSSSFPCVVLRRRRWREGGCVGWH